MAMSEITLTTSYQLLASVPAVFTVSKGKGQTIAFNNTGSGDIALKDTAIPNKQFEQRETKNTYCKLISATDDDVKILVDAQG